MTENERPLSDPETAADNTEADAKPREAQPRKRRPGVGGLVFAGVILAVAVAAWSFLGQRARPVLPNGGMSGGGMSEGDFTGGGSPNAGVEAPPSLGRSPGPGSIGTSVADQTATLSALQQRVAKLERRRLMAGSDGGVPSAALTALEARVQAIEAALAAGAAGTGGEGVDPEIAKRVAERVAGFDRRLNALENRTGRDAYGGHRAASLAFAVEHLRATVLDGRPYGADLGRVSALVATTANTANTAGTAGTAGRAGPWARIAAAVDRLRGHAADGIPTIAGLRREFDPVARAILSPTSRGAEGVGGDWVDGLRARLASIVTVRRTGEVTGADPEARVARAEMRLREGDVAAAVQELAALDGAAGVAAAPWLAAAGSRLEAQRALEELDAAGADIVADITAGVGADTGGWPGPDPAPVDAH